MANLYGGSGGGTNLYGGSRKSSKNDDGHWYDIFGNAAKEIKGITFGLANTAKDIVTTNIRFMRDVVTGKADWSDPFTYTTLGSGGLISRTTFDMAKNSAKATWQDWSPLFTRGDVGQTWRNFKEHPISMLLDVASIASLGAAAPARGAAAAGRGASAIGLEGVAGRLRNFSDNSKLAYPATRPGRDLAFDKTGNLLTEIVKKRSSKPDVLRPIAPAGQAFKFYSRNPLTRSLQMGRERIYAGIYDNLLPLSTKEARHRVFGKDFQTYQHRQLERELRKERSAHGHAADVEARVAMTGWLDAASGLDVLARSKLTKESFMRQHEQLGSHSALADDLGAIIETQRGVDDLYFSFDGKIRPIDDAGGEVRNYYDKDDNLIGSMVYNRTGPELQAQQVFFTEKTPATSVYRALKELEEIAEGRTINFGEVKNPKLLEFLKRRQNKGSDYRFWDGTKGKQPNREGIDPLAPKIEREKEVPLRPRGFLYQRKPGLAYEKMEAAAKKKGISLHTPEGQQWMLENFPKFATTRKADEAVKDGDKYKVVYRHASTRWAQEAANSNRALKAFYDDATQVWIWAQLGNPPRYLINNAVGTQLMHMASSNPIAALHGILDWHAERFGPRAAAKEAERMARKFPDTSWQKSWYDHIWGGISRDILNEMGGRHQKAAKVVNKTMGWAFRASMAVEGLIRNRALTGIVRSSPEVRKLVSEGHTFNNAADIASRDPAFRARVTKEVEQRLGQYYHYTKFEKSLKRVMPFYGWSRAITNHVRHLPAYRKWMIANLGEEGVRLVEEEFGEGKVPTYGFGFVSLGDKGESLLGIPGSPGRLPMLSTSGLNPFATIGDLAGAGAALVGAAPQEELYAAGINPLLTGVLGAVTGRDPRSGISVGGGPVGTLLHAHTETAKSIPLARLLTSVLDDDPSTYEDSRGRKRDRLFSNSWEEVLAGILGAPIKQVDQSNMREKAAEQKKAGIL